MRKFVPCNLCNNGYIYNSSDQSVTKCDCLRLYQKEIKKEIALKKANIENFNFSFDSYRGKDSCGNVLKLKKFVADFDNKYAKGSHLYLYGANGTQKTTLAKSILAGVISNNCHTGYFILMNDLMNIICPAFQSEQDKLLSTFLETCDLLVVDDCFSAKKVTLYKNSKEYQMSFLDAFFRKRLEQNKCDTIFTSNVPICAIEQNGFSYDIMNLLEREISIKSGELTFSDVFVDNAHDIDIKSLWD